MGRALRAFVGPRRCHTRAGVPALGRLLGPAGSEQRWSLTTRWQTLRPNRRQPQPTSIARCEPAAHGRWRLPVSCTTCLHASSSVHKGFGLGAATSFGGQSPTGGAAPSDRGAGSAFFSPDLAGVMCALLLAPMPRLARPCRVGVCRCKHGLAHGQAARQHCSPLGAFMAAWPSREAAARLGSSSRAGGLLAVGPQAPPGRCGCRTGALLAFLESA